MMQRTADTNKKENSKKRRSPFYKILIICVVIFAMTFLINGMFNIASNRVESMSQEEQDEVNEKWNALMRSLEED
jgi:uncharacterized membrane protein YvbJ